MRPAIVSGIVTGDAAQVSWGLFVCQSLVKVPVVFVKVNLSQFPSDLSSGEFRSNEFATHDIQLPL